MIEEATHERLGNVATATITAVLQKRGIRSTFMSGLLPIKPGQRMVGEAHTLRFLPIREDLIDTYAPRLNTQRAAIEALQPGEVLVIDARNETDAGTIGDIFAMRAIQLRAAGIVTDGAVRDTPGVAELAIPTYFQAPNAASLWLEHIPLDVDVPITCSGALVMPGDVVVGDAEGAVVLPAALAEEIAHAAVEQELREEWALERVVEGESIRGIYPVSDERRPDYERWLETRKEE